MLRARASKAAEDVGLCVEPARLRKQADGPAHGLIGHLNEAEGHFVFRHLDETHYKRNTKAHPLARPFAEAQRSGRPVVERTGGWQLATQNSLISAVRCTNAACVAAASSGWSSVGPKMCGKYCGRSRPSCRFASVTASNPPFR